MDGKKLIIGIVIIVILISALLIGFSGYLFDMGYKVRLSGTATHWGWPDDNYGLTVDDEEISKDKNLFSTLWFWETNEMIVKAETQGPGGKMYHSETWIGRLGTTGTSTAPWSVTLRHLPPGSYNCYIELYDVEKGFLGLFETGRELKESTTYYFEIIAEEIEEY